MSLVGDAVQQKHLEECEETRLAKQEIAASAHLTCGICMEQIVPSGRRFGLLQNCSHPFCLECLRSWRSSHDDNQTKETVRACPLCRAESYFITPCSRMITDPTRKAKVIAQYKQQMKSIPCTYFAAGTCPFGNSCFYAHLNPVGGGAALANMSLRAHCSPSFCRMAPRL